MKSSTSLQSVKCGLLVSAFKERNNRTGHYAGNLHNGFFKIQSLEKSSQIRSWLNRIAVNKCKNYLKGKGEIQLDDEIFENQAIVDERISIPRRIHFRQGKERNYSFDYAGSTVRCSVSDSDYALF